jgi:hypothetical protein
MAQVVAISKTAHGDKKWKRYESYDHAKRDAVAPLTIQELVRASKIMPICFIKMGEGYLPAALQSLVPNINLFVAPNGKWVGGYTPACYRSYPFLLAKAEEGKTLLCADMDSGLIGDEGEPLFVDGEPAKEVTEVLGFLNAVQANREASERVCAVLAKHELITPWELKVKTSEGEKPVRGLYRIDETALNSLPAEALAEVRDGGGLPVAFCQLLSIQNLPFLAQLAKLHEKPQEPEADALVDENGELDLEFMNDGGTIKF